MIPGTDACCILLYGDIGEYDDNVRSGDIARELLEAEALTGKVDVRINSNGGEPTLPSTWTASPPAWPPSSPFAASPCR